MGVAFTPGVAGGYSRQPLRALFISLAKVVTLSNRQCREQRFDPIYDAALLGEGGDGE